MLGVDLTKLLSLSDLLVSKHDLVEGQLEFPADDLDKNPTLLEDEI
jgi:hypothetical protein